MRNKLLFSFILLFFTAALFSRISYAQGTLTELINNGPDDKRINIVVFGDGYMLGQQADFEADALNLANYLLSVEPFSEYSSYYNVYSIYVASTHPGVDHPSQGIYRDTYFNGTFDSYGIERLTTIPPNNFNPNYADGVGKVFDLLATYKPDYDIVLMLFNDDQYGGSGGLIAISSTNGAAPEIVAHEIGHSFADLNDEYDTYTPGYSGSEGPNTTAETNPKDVKWNDWFISGTPFPTPETGTYADVVGLFEGACYETTGWYRPMLNCKMKALSYPYCTVCTEELVKSQYKYLSPIEDYAPAVSSLTIAYEDSEPLSVTPLTPAGHSMTVQWYLDDTPIDGETGTTFNATGPSVGPGTHIVKALVHDPTAYVRNDPLYLLNGIQSWTVEVTGGYICGDVDGNLEVNVLDIIYLIAYKYKGGPAPSVMNAADVNSDGTVNVLDIIALIDFKFKGGPSPNCP